MVWTQAMDNIQHVDDQSALMTRTNSTCWYCFVLVLVVHFSFHVFFIILLISFHMFGTLLCTSHKLYYSDIRSIYVLFEIVQKLMVIDERQLEWMILENWRHVWLFVFVCGLLDIRIRVQSPDEELVELLQSSKFEHA